MRAAQIEVRSVEAIARSTGDRRPETGNWSIGAPALRRSGRLVQFSKVPIRQTGDLLGITSDSEADRRLIGEEAQLVSFLLDQSA